LPVAAHIQAVLDRIDVEVPSAYRAARRAHVIDSAGRYEADPAVRARTLRRIGIADGDHRAVIAAARQRLAIDTLLRHARPFDPPPPVKRWSLLSVWIGERRLLRQTLAVARRFAPRQLAMAAE